MKSEIEQYIKNKYIVFSIGITQKEESNIWKKSISFPKKGWRNLTESLIEKTYKKEDFVVAKEEYKNGLAMETGKKNNIIVIDIDNVDDWFSFLKDHKQEDIKGIPTVKTGKGLHYYFKYSTDLDNIKSSANCFDKKYSIDIRTNGGCIILPPSSYYNKNIKAVSTYTWVNSIFDTELIEIPTWLKDILLNKKEVIAKVPDKEKVTKKKIDNVAEVTKIEKNNSKHKNTLFTYEDIEKILDMLSIARINNYDNWLSIGMCLHNINNNYVIFWDKISKKGTGYKSGTCDNKWKTFKKNSALGIGSLLYWAKLDNPVIYKEFWKNKKINNLISLKYPNDNLVLGETQIVNKNCHYTTINSNNCLIKGAPHTDCPNSMYIEMAHDLLCIKCKHSECFGKLYPCDHIKLNKQEMNILFNGDVTININNMIIDNDYVDFQQIDIYENDKINYLVYDGLINKSEPLAEIIYYYNKDKYIYAEDEKWYVFENHIWTCTGKKCPELKSSIKPTIKNIYEKLIQYYKDNGNDMAKILKINNLIANVSDNMFKNNIMSELSDIYALKSNPGRDFTQKLDTNQNLIGFENGIYDLLKNEFRNGLPEDFISMSTGYNYVSTYSNRYEELLKFLHDILPDEKEYEYFMLYLSHGLHGNVLELFTILTGVGRNGKSKILELIVLTFGDYLLPISSTMLTRPRPDANQPDPGLLNLAKRRIVIASEPEKNCKLNTGFLKFITGRDITTLRTCHSNDIVKFSPKFLTFFICNDIPECDDIDNAFSRRLRCINFPTEFVDDPKNSKQRLMDASINEKFDSWKSDFILLLISYYKKYNETKKLAPTEKILEWTNKYKEETDMYLSYLNECTEVSESHMVYSYLYENFKMWFKDNNPNTKIPNKKDFSNGIKKHKEIEKIKISGKVVCGIKNLGFIDLGDI